ncbi:MAG: hypothetical protein ABSH28_04560 [Acidobacteriota bacterium]|jgi:hypothetical protein
MAEELIKGSGATSGKEDVASNSAEKPSRSGHNEARRGLIKAGIVGVPLILTLKGTAAMAQGGTQLTNAHGSLNPPPQTPAIKK